MHVIHRCLSQVLGVIHRYYVGVVRRYYVGVVRRYALAFLTTTVVVARSVLILLDARFRICRTPVPICLGRPFVYLWTPVCAFVRRPYPYPCVQALGGNFIMTLTVFIAMEL